MAVAAFKSTSRRAAAATSSRTTPSGSASDKETKKVAPRRSRSVCPESRSQILENSTASADFLIKRDNPLYWSSSASPPAAADKDKDKDPEEIEVKNLPTKPNYLSEDDRRGRLATRNADAGKSVSGIGRRSLPRVDTGRRGRSVSRGPGARGLFANSESEAEQESSLLMKSSNRSDRNTVPNADRKSRITTSLKTRSNGSATSLPSSPALSCKDRVLGSSFSDAEERTIKAVFEQIKSYEGDNFGVDTSNHIYETVQSEVRRAIADIQTELESSMRRSNATAIASADVTDIPPDLVNPSAVELVLDIRREYANKLGQSQERARKLRADLSVEEHRGLELSRILKEVLPDPKVSNVQKRTGRKTSMERRKMSKRLTDEALAYFDECVSLSTFDSSDFSSPEDPPINLVGPSAPVGNHASFSQGSSRSAANCFPIDKQDSASICSYEQSTPCSSKVHTPDEVGLPCMETQWGRRSQFSFSHKPNDAFEHQHDIREYAKNFERNVEKDNISPVVLRPNYLDLDEYALQASPESMFFDRVLFENRIESGSMLLCHGGIAISLTPFASLF